MATYQRVFVLLALLALLGEGCTRLHTFRMDRLDEPVLVTSSSLDTDEYTPIAFIRVRRWRLDPGSMFRKDYESPVGYQLLNDHLVRKAVELGADAVVDVKTKYTGGLLLARAKASGMAVKRVAPPPAKVMPPVEVPTTEPEDPLSDGMDEVP